MTYSESVKKLVQYDWKEGIVKRIAGYLLIVPFVLVYAVQYCSYLEGGGGITSITMGDFLLYLWEGIGFPMRGMAFSLLPFRYLLLLLLPIWNVAAYPCRDWRERGSLFLPRIRNAGAWWICKCFWLLESAACYMLILSCAVIFSVKICGMEFVLESGKGSEFVYGVLQPVSAADTLLYTMILPFILLVGVCAVQMVISLIWNLAAGFLVQIIILLVTLFWHSIFSVGSYFMTRRTCLNPEGLTGWPGIMAGVICYAGAVLIGIRVMQKKDIL